MSSTRITQSDRRAETMQLPQRIATGHRSQVLDQNSLADEIASQLPQPIETSASSAARPRGELERAGTHGCLKFTAHAVQLLYQSDTFDGHTIASQSK